MPEKRAVIFANGTLRDPDAVRALIRPDDHLIAADGGVRHALALGLRPAVVIGDFDSLANDERRRLEEEGAHFVEYPRDKDETDLELALRYTLDAGYRSMLIVAALGGRLDQSLANLALLTDPALAALEVRLEDGIEEAFFVHHRAVIEGRAGDSVSLLPWGKPVKGVVAEGLKWRLRGETLYPHKTRGVSNELLGETARISLKSGLLLCVHWRGSSTINRGCHHDADLPGAPPPNVGQVSIPAAKWRVRNPPYG